MFEKLKESLEILDEETKKRVTVGPTSSPKGGKPIRKAGSRIKSVTIEKHPGWFDKAVKKKASDSEKFKKALRNKGKLAAAKEQLKTVAKNVDKKRLAKEVGKQAAGAGAGYTAGKLLKKVLRRGK